MSFAFCHTCFQKVTEGAACPACGWVNAEPEPNVLLPGRELLGGRFKIGRALGRGGFGITYAAWDYTLARRVAIKELFPQDIAGREAPGTQVRAYTEERLKYQDLLKRFEEEARKLAQFGDHPAIVKVHDYFPENGTGYMVMEFLDGGTLRDHARKVGRIAPLAALDYIMRVADALRAVHAKGMNHRDISPDNVFLTSEGLVKLIDFGAARVAVAGRAASSLVAKKGYSPPEQYDENAEALPQTDIYSLTATLYMLVAGEHPLPWWDRKPGEKLLSPEQEAAMPPGFASLLERGMALKPGDRHPNVEAFLGDVQNILAPHKPGPGAAKPTQTQPTSRPRAKKWVAAGSAASAIAACAALAFIYINNPPAVTAAPQNFAESLNPASIPALPVQNRIDHLRERIRRAAGDLKALGLLEAKQRLNRVSLSSLAALNQNNPNTVRAVQRLQQADASLGNDIRHQADNYLDEVEGLAAADSASGDMAFSLERNSGETRTLDLLQTHLAQYRTGALSQDRVFLDAPKLNQEGL